MTPIAAIEVPEVFARNPSQDEFYRRGWRDAEAGDKPVTMSGYPASLALAYAAGGMDALCAADPFLLCNAKGACEHHPVPSTYARTQKHERAL